MYAQYLLLVLLALLPFLQPSCAVVTAAPGFISQTQFASCSQYEGVIDCGDTNNNVTVLNLSIAPGTGGQTSYIFNTVSNVASQPALGSISGEISCPKSGGQCTVTDTYRVTITTKPLVVYYDFQDISLSIPHFYSAHHTNINDQSDGNNFDDYISTCQGTSATVKYENPDQPSPNSTAQETPSSRIGVYFQRVCSIETGPIYITNIDYSTNPASFRIPRPTFGFVYYQPETFTFPNAYQCSSPQKLPKMMSLSGTQYPKEPESLFNWLTCSAPKPVEISQSNPLNPQCPYFMFPYNGRLDFLLRASLPGGNPDRKNLEGAPHNLYAACGNPGAPGVSANDYERNINGIYPTTDWHGGFDYDYNLNGANVASNNAKFFAEPLQTRGTDLQGRCNRVLSFLNDQSPLRQYYGNWIYLGAEYAGNIRTIAATHIPSTYLMTWPKMPVIIGCGEYFSDPNVTPVSLDDTQAPYYKSNRQSYGTRYKNSNYVIPCGTNDFFCGTGQVGYIDASNTKVVSWAKCFPSDGCGPDRLGIIEHKNSSPRRYQTADTLGMGGPTCQVNEMQRTAKPYFEATATLEKKNAAGGWNFISNTTVSNLARQDYAQVFGAEAAQAADALNFFGRQGPSTNTEKSIISLTFDGFTTPNGQIAPDFPEALNLIICNTTSKGATAQVFMADPSDPSANPWIKIDAAYTAETGGPKLGGYVPTAKYLRYVLDPTRNPNPNGTWWAFVPQNWFGFGPGQLGIQPQYYASPFNAQYTCSRGRYATVPGHIESFDWTIQDRMTDQFYNNGAKERALRAQLKVCTPCVINGFFRDYDQQVTCDTYRNYDPSNPMRFMFPSFVAASPGASCGVPRCWINGLSLFCNTDATTNNGINALLRLAVLGTVIQSETVLSAGQFILNDPNRPFSCGVDQGTNTGTLRVWVQNTGSATGTYQVYGNCTNNIALTPTIVADTAPGAIVQVDVNVAQAGLLPSTTNCTIFLGHPTYTNIVFDRFDTSACVVFNNSDIRTVRYEETWGLCELVGICNINDPGVQLQNSRSIALIATVIALVGTLIGFVVIAVVSQKKSEELRAKQRGLARSMPR